MISLNSLKWLIFNPRKSAKFIPRLVNPWPDIIFSVIFLNYIFWIKRSWKFTTLTGWGSRIFYAEPNNLADWIWTAEKSDPNIFESVRMFRHGQNLYMIARTDPGKKPKILSVDLNKETWVNFEAVGIRDFRWYNLDLSIF